MAEVIIKTQAEIDALPARFEEWTRVRIVEGYRLVIKKRPHNASVEAWGNASVEAWGNASVEAWENASVEAWENASVVARENASVEAWGNASVVARENASVVAWENASVEAWENASVEAWGNASVVAWGNASVVAWGNASVVARENASVVARENASVEAWGNASVEAWGNASVEAWGNASVEARENASVEAWENASVEAWENASVVARENASVEARGAVAVRVQSAKADVSLFGFAVAFLLVAGAKAVKKALTATIIEPVEKPGVPGWLERNALAVKDASAVIFKRVSADWKTQEGTPNETVWAPGTTVEHPRWEPTREECGPGKFHGCSRAYFCDEFRSTRGDRYVAIRVATADMHAWERAGYPHKIAFRKGEVLHEVDRWGKKLRAKVGAR